MSRLKMIPPLCPLQVFTRWSQHIIHALASGLGLTGLICAEDQPAYRRSTSPAILLGDPPADHQSGPSE